MSTPDGVQGILGMAFDNANIFAALQMAWGQDAAGTLGRSPITNLFAMNESLPNNFDIQLGRPSGLGEVNTGTFIISGHAAGFEDVSEGHLAGARHITDLLGWCREVGVDHVTLWLLSTDNLRRDPAELEPLPGEPTGEARPVRADLVDEDGVLQLDLSTSDLPAADGYYEVWLIDTNVDGMVSLGPARPDGRYAVPADVDPGQFPIVDVSIEPPDGNPTHSGVSVLRGSLA